MPALELLHLDLQKHLLQEIQLTDRLQLAASGTPQGVHISPLRQGAQWGYWRQWFLPHWGSSGQPPWLRRLSPGLAKHLRRALRPDTLPSPQLLLLGLGQHHSGAECFCHQLLLLPPFSFPARPPGKFWPIGSSLGACFLEDLKCHRGRSHHYRLDTQQVANTCLLL